LSLPNFSRTYFSLSFFYCSKHTVTLFRKKASHLLPSFLMIYSMFITTSTHHTQLQLSVFFSFSHTQPFSSLLMKNDFLVQFFFLILKLD
jgi:hypothetical protein